MCPRTAPTTPLSTGADAVAAAAIELLSARVGGAGT